MKSNSKEVQRYTISIGMNDSESYEQKFETERILKLVSRCCKEYGMCYSYSIQTGGYIHDNGTFVTENSIVLVCIDEKEEKINELAKDICCFLNQESVLVTVDKVVRYYISEKIDKN